MEFGFITIGECEFIGKGRRSGGSYMIIVPAHIVKRMQIDSEKELYFRVNMSRFESKSKVSRFNKKQTNKNVNRQRNPRV
jgi:antitoxin component of MazEF toxin-antitoxin module